MFVTMGTLGRRHVPVPKIQCDANHHNPANKEPPPARPLLRHQPTSDLEQTERNSQEHEASDQSPSHYRAPGESSGSAGSIARIAPIAPIAPPYSAHLVALETSVILPPTRQFLKSRSPETSHPFWYRSLPNESGAEFGELLLGITRFELSAVCTA
jgi:hypothetical protein